MISLSFSPQIANCSENQIPRDEKKSGESLSIVTAVVQKEGHRLLDRGYVWGTRTMENERAEEG